MEDKIDLVLNKDEIKEITLDNDIKIKVKKNISIEDYENTLEEIKIKIFADDKIKEKWLGIYLIMRQSILFYCTNINIKSLNSGDYISKTITDILNEIDNYSIIENILIKECQKISSKDSFDIFLKDIPNSLEEIKESINGMDMKKLETIAKSVAWNQSPALGNMVAPISHK